MSARLGVGVVGCGQIAQTIHLRVLQDMPQVEIVAICDIDPDVVDSVGERFGVQRRFVDADELVRLPEVDVVLVATRDHVRPALAAIAAGNHVLVEKPISFDTGSAREIVDAAGRACVVGMVGYMRRYDPCLEALLTRRASMERIRSGRIHDYAARIGKDRHLFALAEPRASPSATGPMGLAEARTELGDELAERFGTIYYMLLMLASHDFSVMRATLGSPREIAHAQLVDDRGVLVVAEFEDAGPCTMELGIGSRYTWFDQELTLYGDDETMTLAFGDPFVPYQRSRLTVRTSNGDGYEDSVLTGGAEDGFRREWSHFVDCVMHERQPLTPLSHGLADVEFAREIIHRLA